MSPAPQKHGRIESREYLDWVRSRPCYFCGRQAPNEAHHHPPKGRGVINDLSTVPVCRVCHMRCHGQTVVLGDKRMVRIEGWEQSLAAAQTFQRFMFGAREEVRAAVLAQIDSWRPGRAVCA